MLRHLEHWLKWYLHFERSFAYAWRPLQKNGRCLWQLKCWMFLISRFHRDIYLMMYLWWSVGWKVKMHRDEWLGRDYFDRISGLECGWLIGEHEKFHCWQSFSTWPRKSSPEKCKKTQRNEWMKEWRYGKLDSIDNKTRLVVSGVCLVGCEWTFNYVLVTRIVKRDHYNASTNFLGWSDAKQH